MDAKTYMNLQNEKAGLETLLSDARAKMKETMDKKDYSANRDWTQAVSRLGNEISRVNNLLKG